VTASGLSSFVISHLSQWFVVTICIYHPLDMVIERAEGVWVYDVDGKRYLDCLSAYSALS
jgi:4-aminobutyrate aminotransferase-like enzyme